MNDEALLAGLAAGEPDVGLAFVRRFQRQVFGVALAVVGDPTQAEDVAQQAFDRAWRRANTFDVKRGSVGSWLNTIAHNVAIDSVRARKPSPLDPADLVRLVGRSTEEPEHRSLQREATMELREAIRSLPSEQARAIVMAGVYGITAREVAEAEAIALGTAKTRIRAAMTKLRVALEPTVVRGG
jgi:RNA polymerase sigma factor (sigma-70 family)